MKQQGWCGTTGRDFRPFRTTGTKSYLGYEMRSKQVRKQWVVINTTTKDVNARRTQQGYLKNELGLPITRDSEGTDTVMRRVPWYRAPTFNPSKVRPKPKKRNLSTQSLIRWHSTILAPAVEARSRDTAGAKWNSKGQLRANLRGRGPVGRDE